MRIPSSISIAAAAAAIFGAAFAGDAPTCHVNPFIGCADNGHCTPAACTPFGLVQAGPDTGNRTWRHCGGDYCTPALSAGGRLTLAPRPQTKSPR